MVLFNYAGGLDTRRMPELKPGSKKYSGYSCYSKGKYGVSSFPQLNGLPRGLVRATIMAANNILGNHTWDCYNAVKPHMIACQKICGVKFSFPMGEDQVIIFVVYLLEKGTLKSLQQ